MRTFSILCSVAATMLAVFAYWGLHAESGQHSYDEMAGMVPFGAGVLSGLLFPIALAAGWRAARRSRQHVGARGDDL